MRPIFTNNDTYLDTSFVVAVMVEGSHHSVPAREEWLGLVHARSPIYYSTILRVEISQALFRMGASPSRLPADVRERYSLHRWDQDFLVRHRWMQRGIAAFQEFHRSLPEVYELPTTPEIWLRSVSIMAHYRLRSIDALHVATAQSIGIRTFITCDKAFQRIDGLNVILVRDND